MGAFDVKALNSPISAASADLCNNMASFTASSACSYSVFEFASTSGMTASTTTARTWMRLLLLRMERNGRFRMTPRRMNIMILNRLSTRRFTVCQQSLLTTLIPISVVNKLC